MLQLPGSGGLGFDFRPRKSIFVRNLAISLGPGKSLSRPNFLAQFENFWPNPASGGYPLRSASAKTNETNAQTLTHLICSSCVVRRRRCPQGTAADARPPPIAVGLPAHASCSCIVRTSAILPLTSAGAAKAVDNSSPTVWPAASQIRSMVDAINKLFPFPLVLEDCGMVLHGNLHVFFLKDVCVECQVLN